jgi:hypothetical protein
VSDGTSATTLLVSLADLERVERCGRRRVEAWLSVTCELEFAARGRSQILAHAPDLAE